jgi:hypothetical protein
MEQILGGTTGLFETTDLSLHNWTMVDDKFYPQRAGGGGIFFPLPNSTSKAAIGAPTHMMNEGSACKTFVLGTFNPSTSKFTPAKSASSHGSRVRVVSIDMGDVLFSEVNVVDGRMVPRLSPLFVYVWEPMYCIYF